MEGADLLYISDIHGAIYIIICVQHFLKYFRTLTAPVSLIQCLKSIKEYAFVKSEYPLIITLEDHLTPFLQAKVAEVRSIVNPFPTHRKNLTSKFLFV